MCEFSRKSFNFPLTCRLWQGIQRRFFPLRGPFAQCYLTHPKLHVLPKVILPLEIKPTPSEWKPGLVKLSPGKGCWVLVLPCALARRKQVPPPPAMAERLMSVSRKVFCGATRPLRPPGILLTADPPCCCWCCWWRHFGGSASRAPSEGGVGHFYLRQSAKVNIWIVKWVGGRERKSNKINFCHFKPWVPWWNLSFPVF